MCFDLLFNLCLETFLILIIQKDIINVYRASCKVSVVLVRFQSNLNCLHRFSKTYSNFMKIRLVRAEKLHAHGEREGQTDRHDGANSRF